VLQTVVGREQSNLMATLSAAVQTIVGREQSNLMDNIICSCTDHCWKGAKQPDGQHYLQLHRPLLEGSKAT